MVKEAIKSGIIAGLIIAVVFLIFQHYKSMEEIDRLNERCMFLQGEISDLSEEIACIDKYIITDTKTVKTTAYCPCEQCCGKSNGITATGTQATAGRTIAVDPNEIPYGTQVEIDGVIYTAEDCGGAIKGDKIDIYFDTHAEAVEYGVRYTNANILSDL